MRRFIILFSIILIYTCLNVQAQSPSIQQSSEIYLQLKKLKVLGSVLYIAAHPDDENNSFLPWLAKEKMYRTGYLSLTRGDGGQNLIGSEQGIDLGLIRTQELLAARRQDGAEQFFSRAYEFGFSKNAAEALRIWDKEKILSDVVWVIRQFQPDVIITRFPGDVRAGHGHHAASSLLAQEAFNAAADSTKFPEQFKYGVRVWQAKRILWNTFNFGGNNTTNNDQFKIEVGGFNPMIGKSYGEIGGEARSMHKSQGEGRPRRRGSIYEYFATLGGDAPKNELTDGVDIGWSRIQGGENINAKIDSILASYQFEHPEKSINSLVALYNSLQQLKDKSNWLQQKKDELKQIIQAAAGLFFEATTDEEYAVLGEKMNINFFVNKRNEIPVQLEEIWMNNTAIDAYDSVFHTSLVTNNNLSYNKQFQIESDKKLSQPYWLANRQDKIGSFNVEDQQLIGQDENKSAYTANFSFKISGTKFTFQKPVQYKYVDPVKGELYQPYIVINPIIVSLTPDVVLTNVKQANKQIAHPILQLQYKSNFAAKQIPVSIYLKQSSDIIYEKDTTLDFESGKVYIESIPLPKNFKIGSATNINAEITTTVNNKKHNYSAYLRSIKYDHIPAIHYFFQNNATIVNEEIKVVGKKIAYITGAGDKVPEAILQLGYDLQYLHESDINLEKLKEFDAIILGIRAYNIFEWLSNKNEVLNKYVENGGNLIVQYLKSNQIGTKRIKVGPYPFQVNAGSRVTEENAEVKFLLPDHSVLNFPNKITSKDFENWVQERSTYQAEQLDPHYEMPLGMNDTGEKPGNGSLAIAKYGKGNFAYVSLVLFRQLPVGNPGAYKLLANLIALPKNN